MERGLILLVAAVITLVTPGVQGRHHLSFDSNTQVNITRAGCGATKLCVETPSDCDPAGNDSCLFTSVDSGTPMAPNGTELMFELRGESMGYIALGLTMNASQETTMLFICAQNSSNNGTFFFRTMERNNSNGMLSPIERRVTEIRGEVDDNVIKCEFNVPNVNSTISTILLGNGSVAGDAIGGFIVLLTRGPLDLSNPASDTTTPATTAVTTVNITVAASSGSTHPPAVLLLLTVLTLLVMLRA